MKASVLVHEMRRLCRLGTAPAPTAWCCSTWLYADPPPAGWTWDSRNPDAGNDHRSDQAVPPPASRLTPSGAYFGVRSCRSCSISDPLAFCRFSRTKRWTLSVRERRSRPRSLSTSASASMLASRVRALPRSDRFSAHKVPLLALKPEPGVTSTQEGMGATYEGGRSTAAHHVRCRMLPFSRVDGSVSAIESHPARSGDEHPHGVAGAAFRQTRCGSPQLTNRGAWARPERS
jgi:hypothetical protein